MLVARRIASGVAWCAASLSDDYMYFLHTEGETFFRQHVHGAVCVTPVAVAQV